MPQSQHVVFLRTLDVLTFLYSLSQLMVSPPLTATKIKILKSYLLYQSESQQEVHDTFKLPSLERFNKSSIHKGEVRLRETTGRV